MARKQAQEAQWITAKEATAILSRNAKRPIPPTYIRSLVRAGKVAAISHHFDDRTNGYLLSDVESYVVKKRD